MTCTSNETNIDNSFVTPLNPETCLKNAADGWTKFGEYQLIALNMLNEHTSRSSFFVAQVDELSTNINHIHPHL